MVRSVAVTVEKLAVVALTMRFVERRSWRLSWLG